MLLASSTHERSSSLTTSQLRGNASAQTTPHCERECAADWIIQEKAKNSCVSQPPRARQSRAQREWRERGTGVKRAADPFNSTRSQSRQVCSRCAELQRRARRCFWKEKTIRSLSGWLCAHPPVLLHNISLIQMCQRAKAPHSRGPNPPPNPRQADHPIDSLTSLIWFPNVQLWSINFCCFFFDAVQNHNKSTEAQCNNADLTHARLLLPVFCKFYDYAQSFIASLSVINVTRRPRGLTAAHQPRSWEKLPRWNVISPRTCRTGRPRCVQVQPELLAGSERRTAWWRAGVMLLLLLLLLQTRGLPHV